jgi:hypothetical protein
MDEKEGSEVQPRLEEERSVESKLVGIFGDKAVVVENSEHGYDVEVILDDGIALGEQKINFILGGESDIVKNTSRKPVRGFEVKKVSVSGVDITSDLPPFCFEVRPESGKAYKENPTLSWEEIRKAREKYAKDPVQLHRLEVYGTGLGLDTEKSYVTVFKLADDLVNVLHEFGHVNDKDFRGAKFDNYMHLMDKMIIDKPEGKDVSKKWEMIRRWKEKVGRETRANRNVLEIITRLREKGADLFPKGGNLDLVKKVLLSNTRSYLETPWFKEQVPKKILEGWISLD